MKQTRKPVERDLTPAVTPRPKEERPRLILRIEELEPRLTPQSDAGFLD